MQSSVGVQVWHPCSRSPTTQSFLHLKARLRGSDFLRLPENWSVHQMCSSRDHWYNALAMHCVAETRNSYVDQISIDSNHHEVKDQQIFRFLCKYVEISMEIIQSTQMPSIQCIIFLWILRARQYITNQHSSHETNTHSSNFHFLFVKCQHPCGLRLPSRPHLMVSSVGCGRIFEVTAFRVCNVYQGILSASARLIVCVQKTHSRKAFTVLLAERLCLWTSPLMCSRLNFRHTIILILSNNPSILDSTGFQ